MRDLPIISSVVLASMPLHVQRAYRERRQGIEAYFVDDNLLVDSHKNHISPSGKYQIDIYRYTTGPRSWNYSRGIITRLKDDAIIADVKRNYGHFWFAWVQHPDGNEYLLCGEDYQGYSLINLTQTEIHTYFPEAAISGNGFCWVVIHLSPDSKVLAVEGCYWAAPYEVVFYDFTTPSSLPLPELGRFEGDADPSGWIDNATFVVKAEIEVRKADGVHYDSLSEEEQTNLDRDPSLVSYIKETVQWKRRDLANQFETLAIDRVSGT